MNKIGTDYIGLLVLGVFNAAIGRQNIRNDLEYQIMVRGPPWQLLPAGKHQSPKILFCKSKQL